MSDAPEDSRQDSDASTPPPPPPRAASPWSTITRPSTSTSASCTCSRTSTSPWARARSSSSSDPPGRASRRSAAPSTAWRRSSRVASLSTASRCPRRARSWPTCGPTSGWSSRASTSSPTRRSSQNVTLGPIKVRGKEKSRGGEAGQGAARARRRRPRVGQVPRPALRRPAAARRHRAVPGHGPQGHALRRADLGARPGDDQRGPRRHDQPGEVGHDDDRRDPRDGVRPPGGQPGRLHGRRARSSRRPRPRSSSPTRSRHGPRTSSARSSPTSQPFPHGSGDLRSAGQQGGTTQDETRTHQRGRHRGGCSPPSASRPAGAARRRLQRRSRRHRRRRRDRQGRHQVRPARASASRSGSTYSGFDVDLANYIAKELNLTPAFVEAVSSQRETLLKTGQVKYIVGTYSITDARKEDVVLRRPVLHRRPGPARPRPTTRRSPARTPSPARSCARSRAPRRRSTSRRRSPASTCRSTTPTALCVDALKARSVDALTTDNTILAGYAAQAANKGQLKVVGKTFSTENYGVGLPKGDTAFCQKVIDAVKKWISSGEWQKAVDKYLGPSDFKPGEGNPPKPAACGRRAAPPADQQHDTRVCR